MIATISGIVLLSFFTLLGQPAGTSTPPVRWLMLMLPGTVAMGICLLLETSLAAVCSPLLPASFGLYLVLAPIIEEVIRCLLITLVEPSSPGEAIWVSGWMGVTETLLKAVLQPMTTGVHVFRVILVVPLHGLLGGILRPGWRFLPVTLAIHIGFNAGIAVGGTVGMIVSPMAVAIAFLVWMLGTERSTASKNSTG